jgi:hypothetical protein
MRTSGNHAEFTVKLTTLCAAAALLAAPAIGWADPIYKSIMPDGRVVYGEAPFDGAQRVEKVAAPAVSGATLATKDERSRVRAAADSGSGAAVTTLPRRSTPDINR